jgi:indolepyruvate ferredoxin oxidoreductase beta subunit
MSGTNFILAGVGGQGTLLASNVVAHVGVEAGFDVKKAEVHGMAQRGGSVNSHVRWGDKIYSPLIGPGEADYLVVLEKLEALRYLDMLRPGGAVLVGEMRIPPLSVGRSASERTIWSGFPASAWQRRWATRARTMSWCWARCRRGSIASRQRYGGR